MNGSIVAKARKLMCQQTVKNQAPAWGLTEIAVSKGKELSKKYRVNKRLVLTALYLAHTQFSPVIKGTVQMNHPELSAKFSEKYLRAWKVAEKDRAIILNAIRAHHNKVRTKSKEAEVMKNAECFKFLTMEGALIHLHHLGWRKVPLDRAKQLVRLKAKEKLGYITLKEEKQLAIKNYKTITSVFK